MKFNLNDYKGNYAMHCKTEEEAESFCRFLHQNGRSWCNGDSYLENDCWDVYKRDTIYCFNEGAYCDVAFTKRVQGYKILEWSNFMENKENVSEFTLDDPDGWISVKDNLPDTVRTVIIYTKWRGVWCGWYNSELQAWIDIYGTTIKPVTHWRELPDPPRKLKELNK